MNFIFNTITMAMVCVSVLLLSKVAMVKGISFQEWKIMDCPEDTFKCLDGHCCKLGETYCSNKSETCEPVFPSKLNLGTEGKLSYCCKNLNVSSIHKHLSTACNYLFGEYTLPKECKGNKELIPTSLSEPEVSKATIAWCLFGIALAFILILSMLVVYLYREIKTPKQVYNVNGIKASPKDKSLSQQRPLSQEQISNLPQDVEAHTEVELLLNKSNSSFDASVEIRDESMVNQTLRSVESGDDRRVDYPPPVSEANQVLTPTHVAGGRTLIPLIISPADNHGNTLLSPSGEHYKG